MAWLGAFSQERQSLWLPKDNLKDSSTWSSPPLVLLRDIHDGLLAKYDCKDSVPPPAQPGARARPARDSQDGLDGASQQEAAPLFLPQLNQLHELSFVRGEDASNVVAIPTQHRVTQQILSRWQPFKDLKRPLRFRAVRSSCVNACSSAWLLRLRTQLYAQRWRT